MDENLDAAKVGKMFVTAVSFQYWPEASGEYIKETGKYKTVPAHWDISATLKDKPSRYGGNEQSMTIKVEQGVGAKLAECLLPVIIADASRKAEQLAADSKAMLAALGERTLACLTQGANEQEAKQDDKI